MICYTSVLMVNVTDITSDMSTLQPQLNSISSQDKSKSDYYFNVIINVLLEPLMGDLNKIVVPKVMAYWDEVAYALRYEVHNVHSFREKSQNPKKCCQKLFEDWLSTKNGASPKTYSTLLSKLREVEELAGVIDKIVQEVSDL